MREPEPPGTDRNLPRLWLGAVLRRFFPGQQVADEPHWIWLWAGFEAVLFGVGALTAAFWLAPADPFGVNAQFPWLWLVPAVVAMRYGSVIAIVSVLTYFAGWLAMEGLGLLEGAFPQAYFLGGLILALVCGQFADVWNSRQRRLRAVNAYLDERLNTLTRSHFLLRLSHERLEQDLLAKPLTLRETLTRLRGLALIVRNEALPGATEFMQVLAQSCQLEVAAVFALRRDGSYDPEPVARLGPARALDLADPLLNYAVEQGDLVHVQMAQPGARDFDQSRYVICAPLTSASGQRVGLLAVERLPFVALNYDTLQLLTVLLGYYADGVEAGLETRQVLARVAACPPEFALDLVRLARIRNDAGIQSAMVALVFSDDALGTDLFVQAKRLKRNMDLAWEPRVAGRLVQISLLPLAGPAAVDGYLDRTEAAIRAQSGVDFRSGQVVAHVVHLSEMPAQELLAGLVARCHA
ncbi:MAG: PelD GGDEF domain-containing protein [Burkholderiales bacterium]|nr:PelD GGDEF domain-containing protein [Burkholderiales bacterium]